MGNCEKTSLKVSLKPFSDAPYMESLFIYMYVIDLGRFNKGSENEHQ